MKKYKNCCLKQEEEKQGAGNPARELVDTFDPDETLWMKKLEKQFDDLPKEQGEKRQKLTGTSRTRLDERINREIMDGLVKAFLRFVELSPWQWMSDIDLFAVQVPGEEELTYACVLGNAGVVYGLAIYPGDDGIQYYLRQRAVEEMGPLSAFDEYGPSLLLSLGDREELLPEERKTHRELGYSFRGREAWPVFRSYSPGYYTWKLTADEMRLATVVLEQSIQFALHCKKHRRQWNNRIEQDTIPWCAAGYSLEEMEKKLRWMPLPEMRHRVEVVPADEILIRKVRDEVSRRQRIWELDWFYSPMPVRERKHHVPVRPLMLAICDHETGLGLDFELVYREEADIAGFVVETIRGLKRRPQVIMVNSPFKALSVYKLFSLLGCEVRVADHMMMDSFKDRAADNSGKAGGMFVSR
ncbi:MAG: hypothetical protein HPY90_04765 [Syntrophothermus sp.]|uniref:DUF7309 domain-containing protein n=1 Tax=Syntrophothermus sp. TaxID=2736299 RepID=UPI00258008A0|nr:hypothetical protein [Syntrophothermus sp.]NSW82580.1 hypothetical protein [Syntrophothermus sp.]